MKLRVQYHWHNGLCTLRYDCHVGVVSVSSCQCRADSGDAAWKVIGCLARLYKYVWYTVFVLYLHYIVYVLSVTIIYHIPIYLISHAYIYMISIVYSHLSARKMPCSGWNYSTSLLLVWYFNQELTVRTCLFALPLSLPLFSYIHIYTCFDTHSYVFKTKGVQYWPFGIFDFLICLMAAG